MQSASNAGTFPIFVAYISQRGLYNFIKAKHFTDFLDESLTTRRSSRIRSVTPNASVACQQWL